MRSPQWAWEAARRFWAKAGGWPPAPDLLDAVERSGVVVRVDAVPHLSADVVRDRLTRQGWATHSRTADRPLRGCLGASDGGGWIFLEALDPDDERRFSLAHELAHFLRHHLERRLYVGGFARRLRGVLRGVRPLDYLHLMERGEGFVSQDVRDAEEEADWLAVELLAPEEELSARLPPDAGRGDIEAILRETFGLPKSAASAHSARLVPEEPRCPLIARLKIH